MQGIRTRPCWIVLAAGLALRLSIAPWGGHPGDLATLAGWAAALDAHGLAAVYITSDANYPPLALALLALSRWVYGLLGGGDLAGPLWWVLLKLPAILADMGIVLLVWRLARSCHRPLWLVISVALNPALIYLSAWWGQIESLYMLGALAALVAAAEHRPFWAGLWLGLGMTIKLQAAVIAPVVLLVALVEMRDARSLARLTAGLALPVVLAMTPFVWMGQGELVARRLVAIVAGPGWLTVNALNMWYLLTGGAGNWVYRAPLTWPDSTPVIAGISARAIGTSLLVVWTIGVLVLAWQRMASRLGGQSTNGNARTHYIVPLQSGALLYLGVFLWPTQAHERYVFGAVVLLAAAAVAATDTIYRVPRGLLYILITLACVLNLLWAAPFTAWLDGWLTGGRIAGSTIALMFAAGAVGGIWQMGDS